MFYSQEKLIALGNEGQTLMCSKTQLRAMVILKATN